MSHFQGAGLNKLVAMLQQVSEPFKSTNGITVKAICPCHDDKNPSLHLTEKSDGTPLIFCPSCMAKGLDVADVLGMEWTEVMGKTKYCKPHKTGHSHAALVATSSRIAHEVLLILTDPSIQSQISMEVRMTLARAAGTLEAIVEELMRADR